MSAPASHISPKPADLEELRGPLTGYCYRMLGSSADTEDAVQETLLRAFRSLADFDPTRARLTTWVHRIATNVCLDLLRAARRRRLVADRGPGGDPWEAIPAQEWVEPLPDDRLLAAIDPERAALQRDSVRLAMVAAFQWLPARQRAVLILRDVLGFSAAETAEILDATAPAVTSALQRARETVRVQRPDFDGAARPSDSRQERLVNRYIVAFERHDLDALTSILCEDARTSMPPYAWSMHGGTAIAATMSSSPDCAGDRLVPVGINGGPGLGQYRPDAGGVLRPFALVALEVRDGGIAEIITFLNCTHRFAEFGLPDVLD